MVVFGSIVGMALLAITLVWWCLYTGHQHLFFPIVGGVAVCGVALWFVRQMRTPGRYR